MLHLPRSTAPLAYFGGPIGAAVMAGDEPEREGTYPKNVRAQKKETVCIAEHMDTFGDVTGATPAPINYGDLIGIWGMNEGSNTIQLRVTDDSSPTPLTATITATVWLNTTIYIGTSGSGGGDKWNVPGNWSAGVPSGAINAAIPDKGSAFTVAVTSSSTPTYNGDLQFLRVDRVVRIHGGDLRGGDAGHRQCDHQ